MQAMNEGGKEGSVTYSTDCETRLDDIVDLDLINQAKGLYGIILTEVVSTD